ncbi:phage baseplate assembly protein V [Salmonella enterica]|nr:phage baseplate assembly protein V [Salmonella enterica]
MAKKVSKFFRIGVEGDTCDGRIISASDIQEMAETYDPRVYGCRINLEHIRGLLPDGMFKRYGDVVELKAEKIDDDSALNGKWALFARITPTDDLIAMNKAAQKVYTSMEYEPETGALTVSGIKTADVTASESITATVPVVLVKAAERITLDTPEVVCTNKLTTATLEVQKGGAMRGNIEHTGGTLKSNGVQVDNHGHGGVQRGGNWTEGTK